MSVKKNLNLICFEYLKTPNDLITRILNQKEFWLFYFYLRCFVVFINNKFAH